MKTMSLKLAIPIANMAMILQRQTYAYDHSMFLRGVVNLHTQNSYQKYEQLTQAIDLFKSMVASTAPSDQPDVSKSDIDFERGKLP